MDSSLYGGKVSVRFNEDSHRYTISTDGITWNVKRGVTSILSAVLAKPALMLWPMDEALKYLFGQEFEEVYGEYETTLKALYKPSKAFLKPDTSYTAEALETALNQARDAHKVKRDKGADTGHIAHAMIEEFLKAQMEGRQIAYDLATPPQALKAYQAFVDWYESHEDIQCLKSEQVIYSRDLDYAGTYDALLKINGKLVMVDIKTTNYSRTAPLGIYADNFIQLGAYHLAHEEEAMSIGKASTVSDLLVINCSKQGKCSPVYASDLGLSVADCEEMWASVHALSREKGQLEKQLLKLKKLDQLKLETV